MMLLNPCYTLFALLASFIVRRGSQGMFDVRIEQNKLIILHSKWFIHIFKGTTIQSDDLICFTHHAREHIHDTALHTGKTMLSALRHANHV